MMRSEPDYHDVQGLLRFGYGKMTEASYALLAVKDVRAARLWLSTAPVTNAVEMSVPPTAALQIAFSAAGLAALGTDKAVLAGFSPEFLTGMTEESRSRRLGDVGANAPTKWDWGYAGKLPHLMIMFFAEPGGLDSLMRDSMSDLWKEAFEELGLLGTANFNGVEPFGFTDGISQPQIDWARQRDVTSAQVDYSNVVALGEFLLGYRNEYNKYTDRPLVDAGTASAGLLSAEDAPDKKDVGRNGTYLVMRQLRQDVRSFWQFVNQRSNGDVAKADMLAAALVGRTKAGDPLVPIQERHIPGIGEKKPDEIPKNQFTFDQDPMGVKCPFGAHVRRANPRIADYPGRPTGLRRLVAAIGFGPSGFQDDLMSSVRFHRILRRGREYGPGLSPQDAMHPAPPNEPDRGLHFICLNANISRQFEFLQNAWIMNTKFAGMTGESDPLLGSREPIPGCPVTGDFMIPRENGSPRRVSGLPQFVTVRGGAYFFLPGLRALRYIAGASAFVALGILPVPNTLHAQTRQPATGVTSRRILTADSARYSRLPQARMIPNVVGMTAMQAVDSLRWTKLPIVQRDSATPQFAAGTVVDQRPRAETPTYSARAETLFVATAPRRPPRRGPTWADVVGAIVSGVASPTRPPPTRAGADTGPKDDVSPNGLPTRPAGDSIFVPGIRVQDTTRVPNLHDDTPPMVAAALKRSRLNQGSTSRDYSDEVPSGRVFRQQPPATQKVATNTRVDVWYSIGPHPVVSTILVPSVVGLTLAGATDSLRRVGLQAGHTDYLVQRGAEGKVVHQVPQERQPAHRGDAVDLTVTTPPKQVSVPSVKGLTRQAAKRKLESVGLAVGSVTLVVLPNSDTVVVSQRPAPPATADSGSLVDLVENRPGERRRVIVPDLSGKSLAEATAILRRDSLVLGDVLRPAVHTVDRVIDQQPKAGARAYMQSRVTVALGIDSPLRPTPTVRVPGVVTLTVDSARHVLADAGFTQLSISSHGESLTSTSTVVSQTPAAGTFAVPNAQIALVADPFGPLPVPKLVGLRGEDARIAAEIDGLQMIAGDSVRRLRLGDEVVSQKPRAGSPRPPDSKVNVTMAVPLMPPLAGALLGFVIIGGGGAAIKKWRDERKKKWRDGKKLPGDGEPTPLSDVILTPVAGRIEAPLLHTDGHGTLIRGSLTLRFGEDADPWKLNIEGNSLVKPEIPPDA